MRLVSKLVLSVLLLCTSLSVFAADAYVNADVNLRSGPGTEYPAVTVVPRWTGLQVQGCVEGYSWCDVLVGADRGWIYAQYLQFVQNNNETVYLDGNGPQLGIPVVSFSLGAYWDSYYPSRPWYRNRGYWIDHRPIYRPLPPRPPSMRPPQRPPWGGGRPPGDWRPPPPRPRPPGGNGPGGRPPVTTPPPRPPGGVGPGGRPLPNPGNGGNRPRPGDSNNGRPPPRPQTRPAQQNN
ncbi:MAG: SH3 domain-containing protein [Rudaea sp.]|nr:MULTISPECIES: SH3 domain-containing protein [unclassified Rudaea]MBN8887643.1 SH3 domain-containing protein [Rudaea sp.]